MVSVGQQLVLARAPARMVIAAVVILVVVLWAAIAVAKIDMNL